MSSAATTALAHEAFVDGPSTASIDGSTARRPMWSSSVGDDGEVQMGEMTPVGGSEVGKSEMGGRTSLLRIGEAAERAGVSPRTLRWYEEIGLLVPSGHSAGGARRYSPDDLERIVHIRELQSLLGLDLGEIRDILVGEDALAGLRREYHTGVQDTRRREILVEASAINEKLRSVVAGRQHHLRQMMGSLEEKAARYAELLAELGGGPR